MSKDTETIIDDSIENSLSTKPEEAGKIIRRNIYWSLGAGIVPIPLFDLMAITGVQIKMIHSLSKLYNVPFSNDLVKSIVASLIGGMGSMSLAKSVGSSLMKIIPIGGRINQLVCGLTLPLMAGAVTYAIGKIFVMHYETGGTMLNFNPAKMNEHFAEQFKKGQKVASGIKI